ncbi:hypothetical protein GDO81_018454 [Engystomops pustulosus]|uniref:Uncharacterized protein n=1 Tax=Engystomops pustulosus TaxID=76066 RepID=A0AAV6ZWQ5_ENGPU|nr:hypothetical protein GDO81_018454 [Engystomops pustulosus]
MGGDFNLIFSELIDRQSLNQRPISPVLKRLYRDFRVLLHELLQHLKFFYDQNDGSVSSEAILWEAQKAVMRGHCISLGSRLKKDSMWQLTDHQDTVNRPYAKLYSLPSD